MRLSPDRAGNIEIALWRAGKGSVLGVILDHRVSYEDGADTSSRSAKPPPRLQVAEAASCPPQAVAKLAIILKTAKIMKAK
jgi:hypothetical protein